MSLSRKALAAMGIEEEKADEIIKMHTDVVNEIKDERDDYKSKAQELEAVKKELDSLKEEASKGDRSPYKKKYEELLEEKEALQAEFDKFKSDTETKASLESKKSAYRKLLVDAGVSEKRIDSVLKLAEVDGKFDSLEFDDKGELKDAESLTKGITTEYGDYIVSKETQGIQTPNPPANNGGVLNQPSEAAQRAASYYAQHYGVKEA